MKKRSSIIGIMLCLFFTLVLAGCGGKKSEEADAAKDAEVAIAEEAAETAEASEAAETAGTETASETEGTEEAAESEEASEPAETAEPEEAAEGIDIDLTTHSSTMVYAEVYNMMVSPDEYVGKTIKMNGAFATAYEEEEDKYYFACIIKDATACCAQEIEFELVDGYSYPEDYPEEGEDCTVVGVFDVYEEGNFRFITLRNAELVEAKA